LFLKKTKRNNSIPDCVFKIWNIEIRISNLAPRLLKCESESGASNEAERETMAGEQAGQMLTGNTSIEQAIGKIKRFDEN
jgi:hypothetical protein